MSTTLTRPGIDAIVAPPAQSAFEDVTSYLDYEWFVDAVSTVSRLAKLPPNWDTYGSPSVTNAAHRQAIRLLTLLGRYVPEPHVGAVSGGGIQFAWELGPRVLELEVMPDGSVGFLRAFNDDEFREDVLSMERPDHLREQVNWLVQHPA